MRPLTGFPIHGPHSLPVFRRRKSQSPSFEEFWHECIEEEAILQRRSGPSGKTGEKDLVLFAKFKKDKRPRSKKPQKDSNLYHIRCFRCDQLGHYAKDCKKFPPQRKKVASPRGRSFMLLQQLKRW